MLLGGYVLLRSASRIGDADDDILIAGLAYLSRAHADAVMDHWASDEDATIRQSLVSDYLADNNLILADDDAKDMLTGSSGTDWFFADLEGDEALDKVTDLDDEVFASDLDFILGT